VDCHTQAIPEIKPSKIIPCYTGSTVKTANPGRFASVDDFKQDVFAPLKDMPPARPGFDHTIPTRETAPVNKKAYKMSPTELKTLRVCHALWPLNKGQGRGPSAFLSVIETLFLSPVDVRVLVATLGFG